MLPIWAIVQIYVQRYLAVKTLRDARRSGFNNFEQKGEHFLVVQYFLCHCVS